MPQLQSFIKKPSRLLIILFAAACSLPFGCKEEKKAEPNPWTLAYAGQYLIREAGQTSRNVSQRYVLAAGGNAELHRLERPGRYGEYRLDTIVRGTWQAVEGRIDIALGEDADQLLETFTQELRPVPTDSLAIDTLWVNGEQPGRTLALLIRF